MSAEHYRRAYRQGVKSCKQAEERGENPYLRVFDEDVPALYQQKIRLGVMEVPMHLMVGTLSDIRQDSFSCHFEPLLDIHSEFADKWIALCQAHLREGIQEPIEVIEFMHRFYVVEGHKRCSVLSYFQSPGIHAEIRRVIPPLDDKLEHQVYHEYLEFYRKTGMLGLIFERLGAYPEMWTCLVRREKSQEQAIRKEALLAEEVHELRRLFKYFQLCYQELFFSEKAESVEERFRRQVEMSEAFLMYSKYYGLQNTQKKASEEIKKELLIMEDELRNQLQSKIVRVVTEEKTEDLDTLQASENFLAGSGEEQEELEITSSPYISSPEDLKLHILFVHAEKVQTSQWVFEHELGRQDLEAAYHKWVNTSYVENVSSSEEAEVVMEEAIAKGIHFIFVTSPLLMSACVKVALLHPDVPILNCSLNIKHPSVRTYYMRLYEAEFLKGVVAAQVATEEEIAYIADYPTLGNIANINAFARGLELLQAKKKVHLYWASLPSQSLLEELQCANIHYRVFSHTLSPAFTEWLHAGEKAVQANTELQKEWQENNPLLLEQSLALEKSNSKEEEVEGGEQRGISSDFGLNHHAITLRNWGVFYKRLIARFYTPLWQEDKQEGRAVNYWWGLSEGVVDIQTSRALNDEVRFIVQQVKRKLVAGSVRPFLGELRDQQGRLLQRPQAQLQTEELIHMHWLNHNVKGSLPCRAELSKKAQLLVDVQGVPLPERCILSSLPTSSTVGSNAENEEEKG